MKRSDGMTLVELLIAISLSVILVGTASFVFLQSQKIMTRVDTRLRAAQSFRVTSTILDQDGSRLEAVSWGTPPALTLRSISGAPGVSAWVQLTAVNGNPATPENRQDVVSLVTHANVSVVDGTGKILPASDHTVLVTYKIKPNHGLIRTLDLLTVSGSGGKVSATVDDSTLPNNAGGSSSGPLEMDLAPGATGFSVRYYSGGIWLPPSGATANGAAFNVAMPSALEFTVYIPESTTTADSTRLSIVRTVELLAPPP